MKASSKEQSSRWTKTQLVVFFVLLLLSVDDLNPVKTLLHVFPSIKQWHFASACIVIMIYIFISDFKAMMYFFVKIFFHSILSIFFRSVDIVGRENIPRNGPVIFTINHANQFMDAVMVVCSSPFSVSYLMAEASYQRRVIGDFAWALGVVPVRRAQDNAVSGSGKIQLQSPTSVPKVESEDDIVRIAIQRQEDEINNNSQKFDSEEKETTTMTSELKAVSESKATTEATTEATTAPTDVEEVKKIIVVTGYNTKFTQELSVGDKIRPFGTPYGLKIKSIENDTSMIVDGNDLPPDFPPSLFEAGSDGQSNVVTYDLLKHTPLNKVFEKVLDRLAAGGAVGIFPEGGSHDRTDLLPLKVGISLIAYSALEKDGIVVPVIPVGLNYFRAYRWRGRAVVEYGRPITIDPKTLVDFKLGGAARHKVCNDFLEGVEDSMRSVIVSAPDYDTLELIHTARRLYQRKKGLDTQEKQDLSRRFVEGYKRLLEMHEGNLPHEWIELQSRINDYRNELKDLGLKDYQVPSLAEEHLDDASNQVDADKVLSGLQVPYHILHFLVVICIAAIPWVFLNLPVRIMADIYAERRRKKALAKSKVKIRGFDVMLTEKVLFCIVTVPTLWIIDGLLLSFFTNLDRPTIVLIMGCFPLFAYTGIIVSDAGMVDLQDLRPYVMRALPSTRKRLAALPQTRKQLKEDLRIFIKTMGPTVGEVYYGTSSDWQQQMRRVNSSDIALNNKVGYEPKKTK